MQQHGKRRVLPVLSLLYSTGSGGLARGTAPGVAGRVWTRGLQPAIISRSEVQHSTVMEERKWRPVDALMADFHTVPALAFSAGDISGRRHVYEKGQQTMHAKMPMASSSKFPASLAVASVIEAGFVSFDTPVHAVFSWWTSDAADARMRHLVTLRHLLTMTSGLVSQDNHGDSEAPCIHPSSSRDYTPEDCARAIYANSRLWSARPGVVWSYNNLHLQVAGAMAARAANLTVGEMLEHHLIRKLGLLSTSWRDMDTNPPLAGGMISSGNDYEKVLQAVLSYRGWSRETIQTMERDAYEYFPGLQPAPNAKDSGIECFGHYSMGLYLECPEQPWDDACRRKAVRGNPGALGYWPVLNRARRYYMQLVVHYERRASRELMKRLQLPESVAGALPALCVSPLRFSLTAPVEVALGLHSGADGTTDPWPSHLRHYTFPWNLLCELMASTEAADRERAVAAAEGRHGVSSADVRHALARNASARLANGLAAGHKLHLQPGEGPMCARRPETRGRNLSR